MCKNSSFIRCFRTTNPLKLGLLPNVDYSDATFRAQLSLSNSYSYTFTNCQFVECSSRSYGGAICLVGGQSIELIRCVFVYCNSTSSWGGSIYVNSTATALLQDTSFTDCYASGEAAGAEINRMRVCIAIRGCNFTNCRGGEGGGGLYLYSDTLSGASCIDAVIAAVVSPAFKLF